MAQEDPLYDFPEPVPSSHLRRDVHQRAQGSLKSVSVLDRLLLTLPVWLQLSINPATALHILQREPPGAFLVRNSRTSRRNVLCVRLTDDCVPSFVRQFGIREQHSTLCLDSSAISFPDLPRLIAFYCVSRDVLPFPLELPEAIAKANSHKQLESISHMGIEFWSSQLNYRGPRETPKTKEPKKTDPVAADTSLQTPAAQVASAAAPDSFPANQTRQPSHGPAASSQSSTSPTVFQKLCPITTRSPRELNCGLGVGALCFVNPLFIQPQSVLHRRHLFKRSLKVRVSCETTSSLSPPLAPPPPPPLMPKTRGKCKAKRTTEDQQLPPQGQTSAEPGAHAAVRSANQTLGDPAQQPPPQEAPGEAMPGSPGPGGREEDPTQVWLPAEGGVAAPAGPEAGHVDDGFQDESDYMEPSSAVARLAPAPAPVSPYLSPPPSPRQSPSQYLTASLSPRHSPYGSPYQSPSPSPMLPPALSPFHSPYVSPAGEDAYHVPCSTPLGPPEGPKHVGGAGDPELGDEEGKEEEEEEMGLLLEQLYASNLKDPECCVSLSGSEGEDEESLSLSPLPQLGVGQFAPGSPLL